MNAEEFWMQAALAEARKGVGTTSPNPAVGAVVVHKGKIIARGFHRFAGGPHAEIAALKKLKRIPSGATLVITLEPCSTVGKTPACTEAIVRSGIRRVVVGCVDPNPSHAGRGLKILRRNGVKVQTGVAEQACREINAAFAKYITKKMPFGLVKMAMSLDGKVATKSGDSRWISSETSRRLVQRMRHAADAVLVGAGTVRKDNPLLTLRDKSMPAKKRPFLRVIADSTLSLPLNSKIFRPVPGHATCLATTPAAFRRRGRKYAARGIEMLCVKPSRHGISLRDLFRQLGEMEITGVLIEGGPRLTASCLEEKVVDRLALFVAPVIIGGDSAPGPVGGEGAALVRKALACTDMTVRSVGPDLLIEAGLKA